MWLDWFHFGFPHFSVLNPNHISKISFVSKVAYSEVLGVWPWTSLEDIILPHLSVDFYPPMSLDHMWIFLFHPSIYNMYFNYIHTDHSSIRHQTICVFHCVLGSTWFLSVSKGQSQGLYACCLFCSGCCLSNFLWISAQLSFSNSVFTFPKLNQVHFYCVLTTHLFLESL